MVGGPATAEQLDDSFLGGTPPDRRPSAATAHIFSNASSVRIDGQPLFICQSGGIHNTTNNFNLPSQAELPRASAGDEVRLPRSTICLHKSENTPPSATYARQLIHRGRGFPLWDPQPSSDSPAIYKRDGTRIGDVGWVTDRGKFDYCFNICFPASHELNARGVPDGFEPLANQEEDIEPLPLGTQFIHGSVEPGPSQGYTFVCKQEEGGVLALPKGYEDQDSHRVGDFLNYARRHARSWYRFANTTLGLGRAIPNGSLYLITGCSKTSVWGTAAWSGVTGSGEFTLDLSPTVMQSQDRCAYVWSCSATGMADTNQGPAMSPGPSGPQEDRPKNQCVFLRGFVVTLRDHFFRQRVTLGSLIEETFLRRSPVIPFINRRKTLAKIAELLRYSVSEKANSKLAMAKMQGNTLNVSVCSHPLFHINRCLLETFPEASLAITHDSTWCSLVSQSACHDGGLDMSSDVLFQCLLDHVNKNYKPSIDAGQGVAFLRQRSATGRDGDDPWVTLRSARSLLSVPCSIRAVLRTSNA